MIDYTTGSIVGIDEAGRGPLAGPVVAAAVWAAGRLEGARLVDSKRLAPAQRARARAAIEASGCLIGVGWAWPAEIDEWNILGATLIAMRRAWLNLCEGAGEGVYDRTVIVDGIHTPPIPVKCTPVVRADATVPEVIAAGIIAKTTRDGWMTDYARIDDRYGHERHKGYGTSAHVAAIKRRGPSSIHRFSFRPVRPSEPLPLGRRPVRRDSLRAP